MLDSMIVGLLVGILVCLIQQNMLLARRLPVQRDEEDAT